MGELLATGFLAISSWQDLKTGRVDWFVLILFLIIALFIKPFAYLSIIAMYAIVYVVAWLFDRKGMDFCGGDIKVLAVLAGLVNLQIAVISLAIALGIWRATRYPARVAFVPYILIGFGIVKIFKVLFLNS